MKTNLRGSLYAIVSGFLYGFLGFFGLSAINNDLSITNMLFWRFAIAAMVLFFLLLPKLKQLTFSRTFVLAFLNGALFYALSTLLYFYACQYMSSGLAMVIFFTYPIVVMLINNLCYQQPISKICYFSMALILGGMCLMIDFESFRWDLTGLIFGVISGFFYACYIVSSKRTILAPELSTFSISLGCMVTFLLLSMMNKSLFVPSIPLIWGNLIGIAIISTAVPVLLFLYSLKFISSTKAAILSVLEPVFVVIFGILLLGEELNPGHFFGGFLILTGALLTLIFGEKEIGLKAKPISGN